MKTRYTNLVVVSLTALVAVQTASAQVNSFRTRAGKRREMERIRNNMFEAAGGARGYELRRIAKHEEKYYKDLRSFDDQPLFYACVVKIKSRKVHLFAKERGAGLGDGKTIVMDIGNLLRKDQVWVRKQWRLKVVENRKASSNKRRRRR